MVLSWQSGAMALATLVLIGVADLHLSRPPRGAAAAGRGAAVRDMKTCSEPGTGRREPDIAGAICTSARSFARRSPGWRTIAFRAALSMLGISWGIVSVVMLLSYGNGFRDALARGFRGAFCDGVGHRLAGPDQPAGRRRTRGQAHPDEARPTCSRSSEAPLVKNVSPEFMREFPVVWGARQGSYMVRGVAPRVRRHAEPVGGGGRFPDAEDVRLRRRVAFIGSEVARKMFGNTPPVGQTHPHRRHGRSRSSACRRRRSSSPTTSGRTASPSSSRARPPGSSGTPSSHHVIVYQAVTPTKEDQATAQVKGCSAKRLATTPTTSGRCACSARRRPPRSRPASSSG